MLLVVALAFGATAQAGLVLNSLDAPPCAQDSECPLQKDSFRGVKKGDIWGPPIKGSNRLPCGTESIGDSDDFKGTPLSIDAGSQFGLRFGVSRPDDAETGTLRLQMKYGDFVSFAWDNGWDIYNDLNEVSIDVDLRGPAFAKCEEGTNDDTVCGSGKWSLPAKGNGGYTGPAVLQVEFKPTKINEARQPEDQIIFYQCIDLAVTNGDDLPEVGPWGLGDPTKETTTDVRSRSLNLMEDDSGLGWGWILLIVLLALLLVCVIVWCLCCKGRNNKDDKLEPQPALEEEVVQIQPEVSKEKEPTPPPADMEAEPEPPMAPQEDVEPKPEKVEQGDGSSGRYYHFTYQDQEDGDAAAAV